MSESVTRHFRENIQNPENHTDHEVEKIVDSNDLFAHRFNEKPASFALLELFFLQQVFIFNL